MSTIKLRNGGKIVRVTENELEKYLTKGYVRVETKADDVQKVVHQKPITKEPEEEVKLESKKRNTSYKRKSNKQ